MLCVRSAGARVHDNIVHVSPREDFFAEGGHDHDGGRFPLYTPYTPYTYPLYTP